MSSSLSQLKENEKFINMYGKVLTSAFIINKVLNYELIPSFFSKISHSSFTKKRTPFQVFSSVILQNTPNKFLH